MPIFTCFLEQFLRREKNNFGNEFGWHGRIACHANLLVLKR